MKEISNYSIIGILIFNKKIVPIVGIKSGSNSDKNNHQKPNL